MSPLRLTFDVSAEIGSGELLTQTAWLFLPDDPRPAKAAIRCLAGGTYDERYWHLTVPGHPGYSFAEHLAAQAYVVVTPTTSELAAAPIRSAPVRSAWSCSRRATPRPQVSCAGGCTTVRSCPACPP